jgi:cell wall assembly regulator SMI1
MPRAYHGTLHAPAVILRTMRPAHIPIAGSPYWDYDRLLLDFHPGPAGAAGQVIGRSDIDHVFVAETFGALLAHLAQQLEDGSLEPAEP